MNITSEHINMIRNAAYVANKVRIETIVINKNLIRGIDDERRVVIIKKIDADDLPFDAIGINRLPIFTKRLNMVDGENMRFDVTIDGIKKNATSLKMSNNNISVDFACVNNPDAIEAPRSINDVLAFDITLTKEDVSILRKATAAMKAEKCKLCYKNKELYLEVEDFNGDKLKYTVNADVTSTGLSELEEFEHKYITKLLLMVLTEDENEVFIGERGVLKLDYNNIDMYILPQA